MTMPKITNDGIVCVDYAPAEFDGNFTIKGDANTWVRYEVLLDHMVMSCSMWARGPLTQAHFEQMVITDDEPTYLVSVMSVDKGDFRDRETVKYLDTIRTDAPRQIVWSIPKDVQDRINMLSFKDALDPDTLALLGL